MAHQRSKIKLALGHQSQSPGHVFRPGIRNPGHAQLAIMYGPAVQGNLGIASGQTGKIWKGAELEQDELVYTPADLQTLYTQIVGAIGDAFEAFEQETMEKREMDVWVDPEDVSQPDVMFQDTWEGVEANTTKPPKTAKRNYKRDILRRTRIARLRGL